MSPAHYGIADDGRAFPFDADTFRTWANLGGFMNGLRDSAQRLAETVGRASAEHQEAVRPRMVVRRPDGDDFEVPFEHDDERSFVVALVPDQATLDFEQHGALAVLPTFEVDP